MAEDQRTCELCGDPIDADQAWMKDGGGATAHSGCVYSDTSEPDQRDRWMPSEYEAAP